ncbi:hypothetical protein K7640_20450 [Micromonospora sp. PLK6-60]|uniref:hypothetical protein n=1 Tax=Micromonospora sp. PLK6-60 TaxID=2873383 RepID=UPI001CA6ECF3|nr:hypothetical protein [Micromonospora sp. PLK6-60]MBY8874203.1 hypothetical protein [Micromonospora sp. PLK6-60]
MDPIVLAAGTALVSAMATDVWQQARGQLVALWRRARPEQAEVIEGELADVRDDVLAAREAGDAQTEPALARAWQLRLHRLLGDDPALAAELRRVLDETLTPALPADERARIDSVVLNAHATGHARIYQAGRDQHITER